ncbi:MULTISPECIES: SMEK domain-containing protein [unclassified Pseudomonas]|uniref:SMEK domain-containing protein n=1 Tax=unclassified Pseudomonas TaxID=196821 RepID=UPI001E30FD5F|nr:MULTISPECIES: SMEK domain-containing protein [unclassified Pseudomonas]MDH1692370.1 SMEK domain-containing protein [Pseudomonas sp. GD03766]UFH29544.1 SMEK domain-containing protein [Pseudomonas sp. CIP-10]
MLTSGYLIGQIIDEFSSLGEQAKLRNRLGLSDLSVFSENFFRDVINIIEGYNLVNTNEDRANEPGVDLGDEVKKIAFQVTTTKTSEKIKNTLKKITDDQRKKYSRFVVLVVGEKQKKYESVVAALDNRDEHEISPDICFNPDADIIDLTDLARKVVGLKFDSIKDLHRLVQDQMSKVKIEFQVPDPDGNYETSGYKLWEILPTPELGDGSKFASWESRLHDNREPDEDEIDAVKDAIVELSRRLHRLPRVTREFLAVLFERSSYQNQRYTERRTLYHPTVLKTYRDAQAELDLLGTENLIYIDTDQAPHDYEGRVPPEIDLCMRLGHEGFQLGFYDFITENKLSFKRVIVELDFSGF